MSRRIRRFPNLTTEIPGGVPTYDRIDQMIKDTISYMLYDFYEIDTLEVTEIVNDENPKNVNAVIGNFISDPNQPILGDVVRPLMSNIVNVPLIGEHVAVIELDERHYYISVVNRKGSVNENSIPGVTAGSYNPDTTYGNTFERQEQQSHIKVNEGDIVFEGRFGQSIKLGSDLNGINAKSNIKIVAGRRDNFENLNNDDSSIYLSGGSDINDDSSKKIEIKSNDIFIKGSNIKLGTDVEDDLQPVAKGDELIKLLNDMIDLIKTLINTAPVTGTILKTTNPLLETQTNLLKTENILSTKVKTQ